MAATYEFNGEFLSFSTMLEAEAQQLAYNFLTPELAVEARFIGLDDGNPNSKSFHCQLPYWHISEFEDFDKSDLSMSWLHRFGAMDVLETITMLEDAVGSSVQKSHDDQWFIWQPRNAPGMYCMLDCDTSLVFDSYGRMLNPLEPLDLTIEQISHFNTFATKRLLGALKEKGKPFSYSDVQAFYGNVHCTERNEIFFKTTPMLNAILHDAYLVIVGTWRYNDNTFSPFSEDSITALTAMGVVEKVIQFSYKINHNSDIAGQDYIILPLRQADITKLSEEDMKKNRNRIPFVKIQQAVAHKEAQNKQELRYLDRKLSLLKQIDDMSDDLRNKCYDYNDLVFNLVAKCGKNPIAKDPMVSVPHPDLIEPPEIVLEIEGHRKQLDWTLEELEDLLEKLRKRNKFNFAAQAEKIRIVIESWEKFAPQFMELQDKAKELSGWIEIGEINENVSGAKLTLPREDYFEEHKYSLSKPGLKACESFLEGELEED